MFARPDLASPALAGCFYRAVSNAWSSFNPQVLMCGKAEPKLFGFPLSPSLVDASFGASKSHLAASVGFSPSFFINNGLLCAGSAGFFCAPIFPALDQGTIGFGLGLPDLGEFLLAGMSGRFQSPAELARYLESQFAYMLEQGTFTVGYKVNPFGFEIGNAQARLIMPNLTQHPAFRTPAYRRPEDRGLPSRLDLLLSAANSGVLVNPLWKGNASDLGLAFPEGSPDRGRVAGLNFAQDYFPYGGLVGTLRLQMPKALVDAPPAVLGDILAPDREPLERLGSLAEYIGDYLLTGSEIGSLAFYIPAPNPPSLTDEEGQVLSPQELLDAIGRFDFRQVRVGNLYAFEQAFMQGYFDGRLLGIPVVQAKVEAVPTDPNGGGGYFKIEAGIPANSWLKNFVESANLRFHIKQSPPTPIDQQFHILSENIADALQDGTEDIARTVTDNVIASLSDSLPKLSLEVQVNNFRIPAALQNLLQASADAQLYAYSVRYDPNERGTKPVAEARRNGGLAFRGRFNFASYGEIPDAELALVFRSGLEPALVGEFDVAKLAIPLVNLHDVHFRFDSKPADDQPYLSARGLVDPLELPLLAIRPLADSDARLGASFALKKGPLDLPLPEFAIDPARIEMGMLGEDLTILIHGASTNDAFSFSSTGPWASTVTIWGQPCLRDLFGQPLVCIGSPGQKLTARLAGHGLTMDSFDIDLPDGISIIALPASPSPYTNTISSGGANNRLSISSDGSFLLEGGIAGALNQLPIPGFSSISAGATFRLDNTGYRITGMLNGGVLNQIPGRSGLAVSGTLAFDQHGITVGGSFQLDPLVIGAFRLSGINGDGLSVTLTNSGLRVANGARLRIREAKYPPQDLFTLEAFVIEHNGNFNVRATNDSLHLPGYLSLTEGSFSLVRTNSGTQLNIEPPILTLFPGQLFATRFDTRLERLYISSSGEFYANTGLQTFGLPGGFVAHGHLEIGYRTNATAPRIAVRTAPIAFGSVDFGASTSSLLRLSNSSPNGAPLVAAIASSPSGVFRVSPSSLTLDPGQFVDVSVRFTPKAAGPVNGTVTIDHNAGGNPTVIAVSGSARAVPLLALSTTRISFGEVKLDRQVSEPIQVQNIGLTNLLLTNRLVSGPFQAASSNYNIPPGGSVLVTVDYRANALGPVSGVLEFTGNDKALARRISLVATGYQSKWVLQRESGPDLIRSP